MPVQTCSCGARYRLPDSAVGKKAKCKKCGTVFTVEAPQDSGIIPLADEPDIMDEFAAVAGKAKAARNRADQAGLEPVLPPPGATADVARASLEAASVGLRTAGAKGYFAGLLSSLLFPSVIGNLIIFMIMWFLLCLANIVMPFAGVLGFMGFLVITGWYCSFRFNVMNGAASGNEDLPEVSFTEGFIDDIALPLLKWVGSWLAVLLPAVVCLFMTGPGMTFFELLLLLFGGTGQLTQQVPPELVAFFVLFFFGMFMWPIVALCVSLGGFASLVRVDLIVLTIIKSFPVYLLTVAAVYGQFFVLHYSGELISSGGIALAPILLVGLGLYLDIVAMRFIGLYYHHFKHRFAWDWG